MAARFGAEIRPSPEWLVAAEADFPKDSAPYLAVGMGLDMGPFEVRAGYNTFRVTGLGEGRRETNIFDGLSGGFGLAWRTFRLDYALVPFGELGQAHRVSLTIGFRRPTAIKGGWGR